jgi:hypothetical protein
MILYALRIQIGFNLNNLMNKCLWINYQKFKDSLFGNKKKLLAILKFIYRHQML